MKKIYAVMNNGLVVEVDPCDYIHMLRAGDCILRSASFTAVREAKRKARSALALMPGVKMADYLQSDNPYLMSSSHYGYLKHLGRV